MESLNLQKAAETAMNECLQLKSGEKVLIITNPEADVQLISQALYDAAIKSGGSPVMIVQPVKTQFDYCEDAAAAAIASNPDIIISLSHKKLGKDRKAQQQPYVVDGNKIDSTFHYLLETGKCRGFWSPAVTLEQFIKTVPVDYARMKNEALFLKKYLDAAETARISCPAGTDLSLGLAGRKAKADDGDFSIPGAGGNLPAGESFISPQLKTASGTIAFSGSIAVHDGVLVPDKPILAEVKDGFVVNVKGGRNAGILLDSMTRGRDLALEYGKNGKLDSKSSAEYARNAFGLGELGIGINPQAEIIGNMLIDEKAYNTCHIAIGSNYDNDANALIHLDGLIRNPTIELTDGSGTKKEIMKDGCLQGL